MSAPNFEISDKRLAEIRKEAEEMYYRRYKEVLRDEIEALFRKRVMINRDQEYYSEGVMRTAIKKQLQDFFLSEKSQNRAARYIEAEFEPALQSCIKDAMSHAARKANFNNLAARASDELNG